MQITVGFNDIYNGEEHIRIESFDVPLPSTDDVDDGYLDWSTNCIFPRTGDGNASNKEAGYFVLVTACSDFPRLVGTEFEWA